MGVYEERPTGGPTMHWQQHGERYTASGAPSAYDPSRDLSPNLPAGTLPASPPSLAPPPCKREQDEVTSGDDRPRTPHADPCAGCGGRIQDRFYLQAVERRWHVPCLRCCECRRPLDSELTCFARDGNIFCKKDYYRLFAMRRCARCQAAISAQELVMRARELVFHVRCFSCALCSAPLTKGDTFGMRDSAVYCRLHYETMPDYSPHMGGVGIGGLPPSQCSPLGYAPATYSAPYASPDFGAHGEHVVLAPAPHAPHAPHAAGAGAHSPVKGCAPFYNGAPPPGAPRQKGRPKKRKPKDLEAMTANMDLNTEYLDMGFSRSGSGLGGSSRTKRMRTSFKHHQLRTMKSYFAINHNPDAKDLKQLSQKTGLPKRVLQVWFQNARAKWRRMMTKQEGKMVSDKCSPDGGLELDSMYPHGPGSMAGSIQSLPPHSPPYSMLGPGSPASLDCA